MISALTMTKRLPPRMYASRISGTISANPRLVPTPRKSVLSTPNCNRSPSLPYLASRTMVTKTACIKISDFNTIHLNVIQHTLKIYGVYEIQTLITRIVYEET